MKRLIIDCSSLLWTSLLVGRDEEFGVEVEHEGRTTWVNGVEYGREGVMNLISHVWNTFGVTPINTILVIEGRESKRLRQTILPAYKSSGTDSRSPRAYEVFNELKQVLADDLRSVGALVVSQDKVEADDVIAYLVEKLEGDKLILSNDGDMSVLLKAGVTQYRGGTLLTDNPYGPFPTKHIVTYKSLVGDTSDKIPGAKGFGAKAWLDLLCIFGDDGLDLMRELILNRRLGALAEDVGSMKSLQKVIDGAEEVYKSFAAASLYPHLVNTKDNPLSWSPGMVKPKSEVRNDDRLQAWAGSRRVVHAGNFSQAVCFMLAKFAESPFVALDLETSTPPESDEWLASIGKPDGVDVIGSDITGCGFTFGNNNQYTFYMTVDHLEENGVVNITKQQLKDVINMIPKTCRIKCHNAGGFEIPVTYNSLGSLEAA